MAADPVVVEAETAVVVAEIPVVAVVEAAAAEAETVVVVNDPDEDLETTSVGPRKTEPRMHQRRLPLRCNQLPSSQLQCNPWFRRLPMHLP